VTCGCTSFVGATGFGCAFARKALTAPSTFWIHSALTSQARQSLLDDTVVATEVAPPAKVAATSSTRLSQKSPCAPPNGLPLPNAVPSIVMSSGNAWPSATTLITVAASNPAPSVKPSIVCVTVDPPM